MLFGSFASHPHARPAMPIRCFVHCTMFHLRMPCTVPLAYAPMPLAVEQIRRMRGGAQAHLMRCADGSDEYYVVKFQNNPQGVRILANELLATRLAARMGLPVPGAAVVEVREELIEQTEDLVMQLGRGRAPCQAGLAIWLAVSRAAGGNGGLRFPARRATARSRRTSPISAACWCSTSGPATPTGGRRSFFRARGRDRAIRRR